MFTFLSFLVFVVSLVMCFVDLHWGWVVAAIISGIILLVRFFGGHGLEMTGDIFDIFD